jgi:addiction module HigA family antidote
MPANRVSQIVAGRRMVTADTALRLGHRFGTEPRFRMNLQVQFDLVTAEREAGARIRALPTGDGERQGVVSG